MREPERKLTHRDDPVQVEGGVYETRVRKVRRRAVGIKLRRPAVLQPEGLPNGKTHLTDMNKLQRHGSSHQRMSAPAHVLHLPVA